MTHQEGSFTYQQTEFYTQYWTPTTARAVVLLIHGMGEHSGRYAHVAHKLVDSGYAVMAFDHFGHGKTKGKRGHNPGYTYVLGSIAMLIEQAKETFGALPMFLYGHSMGGNAVINFVLRNQPDLQGAIATSPFLKLAFQPPAWKLTLGKVMQKIAPSITLGNELDANDISRIPEEVANYQNDPLVHDKISPNFSLSFIDSGAWAIENGQQLQLPMLVLHGTDDKIIDCKGSEAFASKTALASFKSYPGGYHELHNDLCQDELIQDIVTWLDKQV